MHCMVYYFADTTLVCMRALVYRGLTRRPRAQAFVNFHQSPASSKCVKFSARDFVAVVFGEPQSMIRPRCDADRAVIGRGECILSERASRRQPPDLVGQKFSEPQRAIRPGVDVKRSGTRCR